MILLCVLRNSVTDTVENDPCAMHIPFANFSKRVIWRASSILSNLNFLVGYIKEYFPPEDQ